MIRRVSFLSLILAILLLMCSCASISNLFVTKEPVSDISALIDTLDFSLSLPTELPTGFLQTGLFLEKKAVFCACYSNGEREITLMAASKSNDARIRNQIKEKEYTLAEINGYAVAFYPNDEKEPEGLGTFIWSIASTTYGIMNATPQEAAGMVYSMTHIELLKDAKDLGRPEEEIASLENLEAITGILLPRPVTVADGFTYARCYIIGGLIAAVEYKNTTETLCFQASRSELIYTPVYGDSTQEETLVSPAGKKIHIHLKYYKGENVRPEAQWEEDGVFYRLTCSASPSREKILTLARELVFSINPQP